MQVIGPFGASSNASTTFKGYSIISLWRDVCVARRSKVRKCEHGEANMSTPSTALPFHPLADLFPLMEGREFDELVADIKANGLHEHIVFTVPDEIILDGRNRYRACLKAGVEPTFVPYRGDDPASFVISKNIHRRHLTFGQKRDLIGRLLRVDPSKSDRQIAETVKASPTTVGTVRAGMEVAGDVSKLDTRTDTKGRKQPAKKAKAERNRKARERRAAARAVTGKRELEQIEIEDAEAKAKAKQLAADLIAAGLGQRVLGYVTWENDLCLLGDALHQIIEPEGGNGADPFEIPPMLDRRGVG